MWNEIFPTVLEGRRPLALPPRSVCIRHWLKTNESQDNNPQAPCRDVAPAPVADYLGVQPRGLALVEGLPLSCHRPLGFCQPVFTPPSNSLATSCQGGTLKDLSFRSPAPLF